MKKIFFSLLCFFIFPFMSFAISIIDSGNCSAEQYKKLKGYIDNINLSYKVDHYDSKTKLPVFKVTLSNMVPGITVLVGGKNLSVTKNGEEKTILVNSGDISVFYLVKSCGLYAKSVLKIPKYNIYYERAECEELTSYEVCKKWSNFSGDEKAFQKAVTRAKEDKESKNKNYDDTKKIVKKQWYNQLFNILVKYWWALIILIVAIIGIIYAVISKKKKNEYNFKL